VNGEIGDMVKAGVVEAYEVKRNALRVATQAAIQFLRVDDVIFKKEELTDSRLEIEKKSPEFKFKGGKLKY
jgi:chaperonin GroEL (HSP60 family)